MSWTISSRRFSFAHGNGSGNATYSHVMLTGRDSQDAYWHQSVFRVVSVPKSALALSFRIPLSETWMRITPASSTDSSSPAQPSYRNPNFESGIDFGFGHRDLPIRSHTYVPVRIEVLTNERLKGLDHFTGRMKKLSSGLHDRASNSSRRSTLFYWASVSLRCTVTLSR